MSAIHKGMKRKVNQEWNMAHCAATKSPQAPRSLNAGDGRLYHQSRGETLPPEGIGVRTNRLCAGDREKGIEWYPRRGKGV